MKAPHVPLRAFVVVMATGILSVGARQQDLSALSWALLVLAIGAYLALAMAQGLRMRADPEAVRAELRSPSTGFGALALVVATEVIASRLVLARLMGVGAAVGACGVVLAAALLPAACASALRAGPCERVSSATGSWFLSTVALESIALAAADVDRTWGSAPVAVVAVALWLAGLVAYLPVAGLLVRRIATRRPDGRLVSGDHWVAMGALAIASVAAASVAVAFRASSLDGIAGGLHGAAVALWVACCGLALGLIALEVVLALRPGAQAYRLERWATVFPLGMYSLAGSLAGVEAVGAVAFWVALTAWATVAAGLLRSA
ncbi:MAG: hypothetical protein ACJ77L_14390 [Solirubrobacteraceae bacterium]